MLRWWRLEARCRSISSIGLHSSKSKKQLELSQNLDVFSAMQSCSSGVHLPWIMAPHSQIMPTLLVALMMWEWLCSQRLLLFAGYNVQDAISSKHQKASSWLYKYRCQQVTVCRSNIGKVTWAHSPGFTHHASLDVSPFPLPLAWSFSRWSRRLTLKTAVIWTNLQSSKLV